MTPSKELTILRRVGRKTRSAAQGAFAVFRSITAPLEQRTELALLQFKSDYAVALGQGLADLQGGSASSQRALGLMVGDRSVDQRLKSEFVATQARVSAIHRRYNKSFEDLRDYARYMYDQDFAEKPKFPRTAKIYMRRDGTFARRVRLAFKRAARRADKQKAYANLLKDLMSIQDYGLKLADRDVNTFMQRRLRFMANRIAQTELHKIYSELQIKKFLADPNIINVQYSLSPTHPIQDICDYFALSNLYGLGPGVYPKQAVPVPPVHPFCRCFVRPRADILSTGVFNDSAERAFFESLSEKEQRRVAGSENKRQRLMTGEPMFDIHNSKIDPKYQIKRGQDV